MESLDAELRVFDHDIDERKAEYDALSKESLSYALAFPFGLICAGIYGVQAELARRDKDALIGRRDATQRQISAIQPVIGAVDRLSGALRDIEFRLVDAEQGANNLRDMWLLLGDYLDISVGHLKGINDSTSLFDFATEFSSVLAPWGDIEQCALTFSALFNRAINDWQHEAWLEGQ
ncbi:hypothetical protein [Pseudomonas putida]